MDEFSTEGREESGNSMYTVLQDLRYAVRQLRQSPGFTLAAVLTLALGIGANTASFSIMDAVILRPLDIPDLDHVLTVQEQQGRGELKPAALANYEDWQRQNRSFEELSVYRSTAMALTGAGDAEQVQAGQVSPNFFSVVRANPILGRVFYPSETEPGRNSVAMLSGYFWKHRFDADPGILGRKIELDQHAYTIVGVMPQTLQYPPTTDVLIPFAPDAAQLGNRGAHDYLVLGRLRKGVTPDQAQAEMNVLAERLARNYPATNQGWQIKLVPLLNDLNGFYGPFFFSLMLGATLFVLLVVCANVANLQLARGIARRPEFAMRTALGAGRWRITRQLLTENILLGLVGAAGGLLVGQVYMRVSVLSLPQVVGRFITGWSNISLNQRAMALSLLLAVGAGAISGFAPALAALRVNLVDQLKSGSHAIAGAGRSRWLRHVFAVAQIALAVLLVIGAGLMARGMMGMLHAADRYDPGHMLFFTVHLPPARYDAPEKLAAWQNASLEKLRALPGVKDAELTTTPPLGDLELPDDCQIENRPLLPGKFQSALRIQVSPGYFAAFHIPLASGLPSGRLFNPGDDLRSQPVAIVSRGFAVRYFPGESPLGHRIRMGAGRSDQTGPTDESAREGEYGNRVTGAGRNDQSPWMTIVGVVEETEYGFFNGVHAPAVYMDAAQLPPASVMFAVTAEGDPLALAPSARKALAGLDPALPLDGLQTYAQFMRDHTIGMRWLAGNLGVDALIALLLAGIGIFGVMANLVAERTREIGVRLAMGARREDVLSMMLRRAAWLSGTGLLIGLALAVAMAYGLGSVISFVHPNDPIMFAGITAAVAAISVASSWLPARRASRVDPMVALRDE
jgi:putative ABC transport system permease protein